MQATKFDSGTGWPSFFAPLSEQAVGDKRGSRAFHAPDRSALRRCEAHLGHVFPDGPQPTGLRYCLNGVALTFEPDAT